MRLLAELQRRNVIRMAGLYLVAAWLITQVAGTVLPMFGAPEWVARTVVILLAIGFLPALVFAWIYELTPEGLRRDAGPGADHSLAAVTGKRMDRLFLAGLVVLIALMAVDRLWPRRATPVPAGQDAPAAGPQSPAAATIATAPPAPVDRRSIAVLPFVNMSPDPDNEYFADGVSEELLNILAGIEGLKVASRTSAFTFKGKDTPIPEIARQLGVHHVLEGSVRKSGDRVKITAQLIDASSDTHLWTQTYQRDLVDIFAVQEEIASAITVALQDILGTRQVTVDAPTRDMEAYQRYLHGRSRFYQRDELDAAIEDLRFAVERDPQFAEAWAFLASTYRILGNGGYPTAHDPAEMRKLASPASDRASALKPDMPMALAVRGEIVAQSDQPGRIEEAVRLLERAAAMPSPDTTPALWLALLRLELGDVERALPLLERVQRAEPTVGINNGYLALAYSIQGRHAEARALAMQALRLNGLTGWIFLLAIDRIHAGDRAAARNLLDTVLPALDERLAPEREWTIRILGLLEGTISLDSVLAVRPEEPRQLANLSAVSIAFGGGDLAFELHEQGVTNGWFLINSAWLPGLHWLREDPRYFRFMERRGHAEYWAAHGYPRSCRPVDGPSGRHLSCPEPP